MRPTRRALETHARLLEIERGLWSAGAHRVAGLDEAGAGPWAGPVVAGCAVLDPERLDALVGVNDSKKVSSARRIELREQIRSHATAWAVAEASVDEIDRLNVLQAALLAMRRAFDAVLRQLGSVDHLLLDARSLAMPGITETSLIKGDGRSLSIAAASILAKVERDEMMIAAAVTYPEYGFDRHKGYGTAAHQAALLRYGPTPLHRRSFAPVRALLEPSEARVQGELFTE